MAPSDAKHKAGEGAVVRAARCPSTEPRSPRCGRERTTTRRALGLHDRPLAQFGLRRQNRLHNSLDLTLLGHVEPPLRWTRLAEVES